MFHEILKKKMEEAETKELYMIKYRDTSTDEVYTVPNTFANVSKILNNKNNQLIFE